jgi:hypothetical protein
MQHLAAMGRTNALNKTNAYSLPSEQRLDCSCWRAVAPERQHSPEQQPHHEQLQPGQWASLICTGLISVQLSLPCDAIAAAQVPISPGDSPYLEAKRLVSPWS